MPSLTAALFTLWAAAVSASPVSTVDLATLSTASGNLRRVYGSTGEGDYGVPVAAGADCDGDGFGDYAMAAMTADPLGRWNAGEIDLVFGDGTISGTLDTAVAQASILRIAGDQAGATSGTWGEVAGDEIWIDDVTGDGIGDLLIGRQNYTPGVGRTGAGALTILVGGAALRQHAATLQYLDLRSPPAAVTITTIVGDDACDRLGIWMRTGDITGDGVADIVVGADQEDQPGDTKAGAVYVIRGGPHLATDQTIDLASFGTTALSGHLARIRPPANADDYHFGATCQIADLDGNGRAEVLIAAALNRAGAALGTGGCNDPTGGFLPGGKLFIAWDDNFTGNPWTAGLSFAISASPGGRSMIAGEVNVNETFGEEILGGLDFDNDGNADLFVGDLVGQPTGGPANGGLGHVLYHAATLKNAQAFTIDSPPAGQVVTTFIGGGAGDIAADTALQGDFDGDGIADLAFSSPHADPLARINAGVLHVFYGQDGPWPAIVDLKSANLPASADVRISQILGAKGRVSSSDEGDTLCYSAAAADVDSDGRTDLITNEMVGNGVATGALDVGNMIVLSGDLLDSTTGAALRGQVAYHNSQTPVAATTADLGGSQLATTWTNAAGYYGFFGAAGSLQVTPWRNGDENGAVDMDDATLLLQALVGSQSIDAVQSIACDVSGDGTLSALDAARILQFEEGSLNRFAAADACQSDWLFWPSATSVSNQTLVLPDLNAGVCQPGGIAFDPLTPPTDDQSFAAIVFGDCTTNWAP